MAKTPGPPAVKIPQRQTPSDRIPRRVMQPTANDYLEILSRAIFQAGLSWAFIDGKWPAFCAAFDGFELATVAGYETLDVERIMATPDVVHSQKKIRGTIENAKALEAIELDFGNATAYVARFQSYADLLSDARNRFAFFGDLSCYYWLFRTGNPVPRFDSWIAAQPKDHPRMREMVLAGRAEGTSSERAGF